MVSLEHTEDNYCFPSASLMIAENPANSSEGSADLMNALYKLIRPLGVVLVQTSIDRVDRISNIQFSSALTSKEACALEQMINNGSDGKVRIVFKKSRRHKPPQKNQKPCAQPE